MIDDNIIIRSTSNLDRCAPGQIELVWRRLVIAGACGPASGRRNERRRADNRGRSGYELILVRNQRRRMSIGLRGELRRKVDRKGTDLDLVTVDEPLWALLGETGAIHECPILAPQIDDKIMLALGSNLGVVARNLVEWKAYQIVRGAPNRKGSLTKGMCQVRIRALDR